MATVSSAQALFPPSATVATGSTFTSNGERFTVQSPAQPWSLSNYPTAAYSRVELRKGDRWVNDLRYSDGRQRVKLRGQTRWPKSTDLWFAYSFRWSGQMPTAWANVTELHSDLESGETQGKPPPFSLGFSRGQFFLNTRSDSRASTTSKVDPVVRYSMPAFPKDTWQNIVVRVKLDPFGNGRLTFWLNGTQKYDSGAIPIGYNDVQGPYFKYGLYRGASDVTTAAEFANVEIGTASLLSRVTSPKPLPR